MRLAEDAPLAERAEIFRFPAQVEQLDTGIRSLAVRFGADLTDAARAAYQTISAGVTGALG